jgi:hypothetical protein
VGALAVRAAIVNVMRRPQCQLRIPPKPSLEPKYGVSANKTPFLSGATINHSHKPCPALFVARSRQLQRQNVFVALNPVDNSPFGMFSLQPARSNFRNACSASAAK